MPSFKEGDEETLEMQLWEKIAEAGVLMAPGWYFSATEIDSGEGHYRISFSQAEVRSIRSIYAPILLRSVCSSSRS